MKLLDAELEWPSSRECMLCMVMASVGALMVWAAAAQMTGTNLVMAWCGGFSGAMLASSGLSPTRSPRAYSLVGVVVVIVAVAAIRWW